MFKIIIGLRFRVVGENLEAVEIVGIDVVKMKYLGVILGGVFFVFGGVYFLIGVLNSFLFEMLLGRGYIVLAVMIFGKWIFVGLFLVLFLFGFVIVLSYIL